MRILISGAGIAGPTLAWFLARSGAHRITIVEKSNALFPHGQNVDIQGSAVTVINKMGLLQEIRKHNTTEKGTRLIDAKGKPFAPFPLNEGSTASPTSEFEILRGDLAAILYKATKDHPDIDYLFNTTIKSVIKNDNQSVKVELSNGNREEFDLIVAADGQWSKVRKQCFSPETVQPVHLGMYAVYYTIPRTASDDEWWNIFIALGSRIIALRPDPHGTIRAMFTITPRNEAQEMLWKGAGRSDREAQIEVLKKEFANAGWQTQRLLDAVDDAPDFYFHVIQQIKMSKWSTSRVVCLGDAAYAPSPLTGMGTSLAIIGAYMLAGEISKLEKGASPLQALEAYEAKFRPFVEKTQQIPPFVPGIAHPSTAWKRWILQTFLNAISKILALPWIAGRFVGGAESNDDGLKLPEYASLISHGVKADN